MLERGPNTASKIAAQNDPLRRCQHPDDAATLLMRATNRAWPLQRRSNTDEFRQQRNQITLGLLFVATLVITLFGRLPLQAAPSAPERPRALLAATSPCASFSDRNIGFDFLGYLPLADGATMLAWRITNPKPKALDAIGVSAFGWQRVKPSAGGTFQGDLGV